MRTSRLHFSPLRLHSLVCGPAMYDASDTVMWMARDIFVRIGRFNSDRKGNPLFYSWLPFTLTYNFCFLALEIFMYSYFCCRKLISKIQKCFWVIRTTVETIIDIYGSVWNAFWWWIWWLRIQYILKSQSSIIRSWNIYDFRCSIALVSNFGMKCVFGWYMEVYDSKSHLRYLGS
jgi:hypothetical protein